MKLLLLIPIFFLSCTDPNNAIKTLESYGYTNIKTQGYCFLDGSENDVFKTRFTAIAINGNFVTGCVSRGIFKGNRIFLD